MKERYKFLGPDKQYLKNTNKSCIAFILRYKKLYLGKGNKGFDKLIDRYPKLKKQLDTSGRDSILKYSGFLFPTINTIIINNYPSKTIFMKYLRIMDKTFSRVSKVDGRDIDIDSIFANKSEWYIKIGKLKYITLDKYRQVQEEDVILRSQEKEESDIKKKMTKDGDIVMIPTSKEIRDEVKEQIQDKIEKNGEKLSYRTIFGRKYIVGIDDEENVTVYDWDGNDYEMENFYGIIKDRKKSEKGLNNINKIDLYLDFIDKEPDQFVDDLAEANKDEIENKLLTDRDGISKKLTRTYPVLEHDGRQLIVGGRFKGYYLDEMINMVGRQIGGSGYYLDDRNLPRPIEPKNSTYDERTITAKYEPYITYDEDSHRMIVVLPDSDKEGKAVLNELAKEYRGIDRKSKNTFAFSPLMYEVIQRDLNGFVLSEKAMEVVKSTIDRNKKNAIDEINATYDSVSTSKIDGMKTELDDGTPVDFRAHQKKAVSKILKDGNGFVGLDTGTGKSLVAVGTMMSWINDGTLYKNGKNGKALFVGDASLRGNFPSEVKKFVTDYSNIKSYFDVISYNEYKATPEKWKEYGCIIFDEAQAMRNHKTKVNKVAREMEHPRKILMTASVLEKSPLDLYNLIQIKNNKNIEDKSVDRKKRNDFINAFCEKVGNKVIGLKEDDTTKRMFRRWVRKETLYIDKEDVKEVDLPTVTPPSDRTISVEMPDEMKKKYAEMSRPIKDTLKRMVEKYKQNKLTNLEINQEFSKVMGSLQNLTTFLALPEKQLGEGYPNPKINQTVNYINNKLDSNESFKTVTFTDKPELASKLGLELSKQIISKLHVVGLAWGIEVYKNGELIEKIQRSNLKKYKDEDGNPLHLGNYQVELLKQYQKMYNVCSINLTKAYVKGHNLQNCDAVLHIDRDTWNNETMEQRTARVWRSGRENPVDVQIFDLVNDTGDSLDEIQKYSMEIERKLFEDLIDKSFDEEFILQDEDYIKIQDIKQLVKNKEAYYYQLNPNVKFSSKIKNK